MDHYFKRCVGPVSYTNVLLKTQCRLMANNDLSFRSYDRDLKKGVTIEGRFR